MADIPEVIWSNTDYPYICLIDKKRTLAFREAIQRVVKPGDVVVEVGAGTGILSLFAIAAGASRVYAVEIDPILAKSLRETFKLNNCEDKVEVIEGDALQVELPQNVDVVIGELIETGLLDEMQVAVMNGLHARGVVGEKTKLIPQAYETSLQLVDVDSSFYGFHIAAPKHDWPYYSEDHDSWAQLAVEPVSEIAKVGYFNFQAGEIEALVDTSVAFEIPEGKKATALKLSGAALLTDDLWLGACNTFSGDKILPLPDKEYRGKVSFRVRYAMSTGMANFQIIAE